MAKTSMMAFLLCFSSVQISRKTSCFHPCLFLRLCKVFEFDLQPLIVDRVFCRFVTWYHPSAICSCWYLGSLIFWGFGSILLMCFDQFSFLLEDRGRRLWVGYRRHHLLFSWHYQLVSSFHLYPCLRLNHLHCSYLELETYSLGCSWMTRCSSWCRGQKITWHWAQRWTSYLYFTIPVLYKAPFSFHVFHLILNVMNRLSEFEFIQQLDSIWWYLLVPIFHCSLSFC